MARRSTATIQYGWYGVLFGALFPVAATLFDTWQRGLPLALASFATVQSTQQLHWMIDTAPLFLGLFAALAGWRQDTVATLNETLTEQNRRLRAAIDAAERADELAALGAENERLYQQTLRQLAELQDAHQQNAQAVQAIQQMTTPVIQIQTGILVIPLVGHFDQQRVSDLCGVVLRGLETRQARVVILDCTGVDSLAADAVESLHGLFAGVRLLGAHTLLSGITPTTAQHFVAHNALPSTQLQTAIDLADAVQLAYGLVGTARRARQARA